MLVRKEEALWSGCFCLSFPGVAVVQHEWRMLSSRDCFFGVSGTCWTLGSRVWGVFVCEWSLLGSGKQGFWYKWKMLGSRDWVFSVIRECWALENRFFWCEKTLLDSRDCAFDVSRGC